MASSSFDWDSGKLTLNLQNINARADRALTAAMVRHSQSALAFARQNATWTDRTTNARNGLMSNVMREAVKSGTGRYGIVLYHTVPYGIWLELRFSGRYAIIRPTLDQEGPKLMATVSALFSRMGI